MEDRFLRLLELLTGPNKKNKALVLVSNQELCDNLFQDLLKMGYPCLSLHEGKDQGDQESNINDFKTDVCSLLVATDEAASGLDGMQLDLSAMTLPTIMRKGAGNQGIAVVFIASEDDKFAPELVQALKVFGAPIPEDLQALADKVAERREAGVVQEDAHPDAHQEAAEDAVAAANPHTRLITAAQAAANALSQKGALPV
ncbi:g7966 [Coccomyxa viridis]|uniref:G7966 protein n=1 Tax=Coccomyxa viridis TaxID=1274662 RepID=A0ABP1G1S3_9CHLO